MFLDIAVTRLNFDIDGVVAQFDRLGNLTLGGSMLNRLPLGLGNFSGGSQPLGRRFAVAESRPAAPKKTGRLRDLAAYGAWSYLGANSRNRAARAAFNTLADNRLNRYRDGISRGAARNTLGLIGNYRRGAAVVSPLANRNLRRSGRSIVRDVAIIGAASALRRRSNSALMRTGLSYLSGSASDRLHGLRSRSRLMAGVSLGASYLHERKMIRGRRNRPR